MPRPVIDTERFLHDLDELALIGANAAGGIDRVAYSAADGAGRDWVEARLREIGLAVERDAAGNTIATCPGDDPSLPPIALGSHTDSVPNGGRYDGSLGVVAAVACVRALALAGHRTRHPVAVVNFACEEATLGGGTLGSRAMSGQLDAASLAQVAGDGRPVADHLRDAGLDPDAQTAAQRPPGSFAAYLELHIEQGGILEASGIPIGLVEGIVGIRRFSIAFQGYANHAGTTPMAGRRDALVTASPFITLVREIALRHDIVGTCGTMRVEPNAPNVIPGRVELGVEIRGLDDAVLDRATADLVAGAHASGGDLVVTARRAPTPSDGRLLEIKAMAASDLGLAVSRLPSGAGHDAMCMAALAPQAMIFVPSRGGVSHSPAEFTPTDDCVNGARVLLSTLLRLDEQ